METGAIKFIIRGIELSLQRNKRLKDDDRKELRNQLALLRARLLAAE